MALSPSLADDLEKTEMRILRQRVAEQEDAIAMLEEVRATPLCLPATSPLIVLPPSFVSDPIRGLLHFFKILISASCALAAC